METFGSLTRMDRRKFLAGFLATAASAGVLGKLGLEEDLVWTAEFDMDAMFEEAYTIGGTPQWMIIHDDTMKAVLDA